MENSQLRATSPSTNARTAPAESARTTIGCTHRVGSSPATVTASMFDGQLGDRHRPRRRADRHRSSRLRSPAAGSRRALRRCVEEAEHRMEPEPTLEVRRRSLLAFGVDLDQRRVDVQHTAPGVAPAPTPSREPRRGQPATRRARSSSMLSNVRQIVAADATSPNSVRLITQRRHVRHTAATGRQHHRHLGQQAATVMTEGPLTRPRHRRRIGQSETDPISELTQQMGARRAATVDGRRRSPAAAQPCV